LKITADSLGVEKLGERVKKQKNCNYFFHYLFNIPVRKVHRIEVSCREPWPWLFYPVCISYNALFSWDHTPSVIHNHYLRIILYVLFFIKIMILLY